jgi:transcriptional regulator with XRE-family HTH domain
MTWSEAAGRLNTALKSAEISSAEVGRRLGVDHSLAWRWRHGQRVPDAEQLAAMASWAGCSVDYILGIQTPAHYADGATERLMTLCAKLHVLPRETKEMLADVVRGLLLRHARPESAGMVHDSPENQNSTDTPERAPRHHARRRRAV